MKNPIEKFLFLLAILLLFSYHTEAQRHSNDFVRLKDGNIYYGSLVQIDSLHGVRIKNDCGSFLFRLDEIAEMKTNSGSPLVEKEKGYFNYTAAGLLFGSGENGYLPLPSLTMVNGYQFNSHWMSGLGFGFEYYTYPVLPLYAEVYYIIRPSKVSPYVSLKAGYTFTLDRINNNAYLSEARNYGGVAINPAMGVKVSLNEYSSFLCSIGYQYQKLSNEVGYYPYYNWETGYHSTLYNHYNRISFKIGFIFR